MSNSNSLADIPMDDISLDDISMDDLPMDDVSDGGLSINDFELSQVESDELLSEAAVGSVPPVKSAKKHKKNEKKQQLILIFLCVGCCCLLFTSFTMGWLKLGSDDEVQVDLKLVPHTLYDAAFQCEQQIRQRYGEDLLQAHMDERSSRAVGEIFKIFYKADVGTRREYEQLDIYCFIEKGRLDMKYFKGINPTEMAKRTGQY